MKKLWKQLGRKVVPVLMMVLLLTMTASAEGYSGDNSLAALGVENGTVTPEFEYSTWEYNVTVAPGTTELILNPVTSDPNASIIFSYIYSFVIQTLRFINRLSNVMTIVFIIKVNPLNCLISVCSGLF